MNELTEHLRWKQFEQGVMPGFEYTPLEILKDDPGAAIFVVRCKAPHDHIFYQVFAIASAEEVYPLFSLSAADPHETSLGLPIDEDDEAAYKAKCLEWSKKDA